MLSNTKVRKVAKPDRRQWESEFRTRLLTDATAKAAFERLMRAGCVWGNVMSFLFAYTFGETMVIQEHARMRDAALAGLKAVGGRLDRATAAMQNILTLEWR